MFDSNAYFLDWDTRQLANVQPLHLVLMLVCGFEHNATAWWCVRSDNIDCFWIMVEDDLGPWCDQVDEQRTRMWMILKTNQTLYLQDNWWLRGCTWQCAFLCFGTMILEWLVVSWTRILTEGIPYHTNDYLCSLMSPFWVLAILHHCECCNIEGTVNICPNMDPLYPMNGHFGNRTHLLMEVKWSW